ncbi:MAG: NAD-dependent epimerase/dehydratase family protein [Bacteroidaceae bacterium]|nr:NAD-dependent epimerase/dehydratase family protein [Bacteroidaceae bacterium]
MKILIIGGTGILSTAVVDRCVLQGYDVTMINRGNRPSAINPQATLVKCDVQDQAQLKAVKDSLQKETFDVVIDFLVYTVDELKRSLESFSSLAKQYVFISSAQVYDTSLKGTLTEDSPKPQRLWAYSVNKLECENQLIDYCHKNGITYTIIRPAVNYDGTRIPYGIFPPMGYHWTLVERIRHGKPIITWNNGENKLNLTRVEDFAEATVGLLGNPQAYNEAFNVAGNRIYSWMDVLNVLGELVGKEPVTIDVPVQFYANELPEYQREELIGGRANDMVCSIEKLKRAVPDFEPRYSLREGVKMTLDYYRSHGFLHGIDYTFDGNTDRIVMKYCSQTGITPPAPLTFIDYLAKGYKADRRAYYQAYDKDTLHGRITSGIKSTVRRIMGGRLTEFIGKVIHR